MYYIQQSYQIDINENHIPPLDYLAPALVNLLNYHNHCTNLLF